MKKRDYTARLVVYNADYVGNLVYVANWLNKLAKELKKDCRKQNKTKKQIYNKKFVAKLLN